VSGPDSPDDRTRRRGPAGEETRYRGADQAPEEQPANEARLRVPQDATRFRDSQDPVLALGNAAARGEPGGPARGGLQPGVVIRRRYALERLIGSGGMGQVWRAKDLVSEQARDPNPFVALKLLNADFESDPDAFIALQRETRKAQELAHPNIITVFAFDIDDSQTGRAFMSMELLEGETLDAVVRRHGRGLPRKEALPIILGMARALEHAHKKGIVHSDFKPGNVFLTSSGVPKVLDFGIARAANVGGTERQADPFDAGVLGGLTLLYASPGMIEYRDPHPADDVYALGLVAYELLAGRPPFERRSAVEARDAKLAPARIRALRRYEWRAIARALEFDPAKRWQNAGEFVRAFEGRSVAAFGLGLLALTLALTAGVFWYQARTAAGPALPLEALSVADQAAFRSDMADGSAEWQLVQEGSTDQIMEAVRYYAKAYAIHPRDADATAGLRKTADYVLRRVGSLGDARERMKELKNLQAASDFYATYRPVQDAIERSGSPP
jgi:hypothetical protein